MNVEPMTAEHAAAMAGRVNNPNLGDAQHVRELIACGPAFAALDGGVPFALLGVADHGGGRGFAWCYIARDARLAAVAVSLTRAVRRWLRSQARFRRVEMVTAVGHAEAEDWAIALGFMFESPSVAWFESGGDALRWALVRRGVHG